MLPILEYRRNPESGKLDLQMIVSTNMEISKIIHSCKIQECYARKAYIIKNWIEIYLKKRPDHDEALTKIMMNNLGIITL